MQCGETKEWPGFNWEDSASWSPVVTVPRTEVGLHRRNFVT
jgi:hypothetical protein